MGTYKPTEVKAWTGGSKPAPFRTVAECALFWGSYPELEFRRIHWRRARYDAHATFRGEN